MEVDLAHKILDIRPSEGALPAVALARDYMASARQ